MFCPAPKPPPKQKKTPKGLITKSHLKTKNSDPTPIKTKDEVYARDEGLCRGCGKWVHRLSAHFHHIIKRSQAVGKPWKHDPRNLFTMCFDCHEKTERFTWFLREVELIAVKLFGWLVGRPMTVEQWKEWRGRE